MEVRMPSSRTAKLFQNGASQAVRLPAEFRFPGKEVSIRRDENTGDVILSPRNGLGDWDAFFEFMRDVEVPEDFMKQRPLNQPPRERNLFSKNKK
jgi:antitoxin VapB